MNEKRQKMTRFTITIDLKFVANAPLTERKRWSAVSEKSITHIATFLPRNRQSCEPYEKFIYVIGKRRHGCNSFYS